MFDKYVVNNISYLHTKSKEYDKSQVKELGVCLNFLDNKAYRLETVLDATNWLQNFIDPDLYVSSYTIDEYDGQFVNLIVWLGSRSQKDLYPLMQLFSKNEAMLIVGANNIFLSYDKSTISKIKKVYPVAIQYLEHSYIVHHNFFNGKLKLNDNCNGTWSLQLYNAQTNPVIIDLLHKKFGDNYIHGDSMESVLEIFYNSYIQQKADH